MKITEKKVKQILTEEVGAFFEQIELKKRLKNVRGLTMDAFVQVIKTMGRELKLESETVIDVYIELALDLKRNWLPKQWGNFTESEKQLFLKTTYPNTIIDESEDMLIKSFTNPTLKKIIFSDVLLAVKKAEEAKEEIKAGEYLGPEEPGGDPKSPYWKEYLEEVIKEEAVNYLKENE